MVQVVPVEPEPPTKLEKQPSEEIKKQPEPSQDKEILVQQNAVAENISEDEKKSSFEIQKFRLSRAAHQYKDASLRRSL